MNCKRSKTWWRVTLITASLICFFAAGQSLSADQSQSSVNYFPGDFLEYWASARLLLDGRNPYSPEQQLALQRTIVPNTEQPLMMWNPPWTLSFILPFGLLSFSVAYILWLTVILACLLVCSVQLWQIYGGPPDRYRIAWLFCFSVAPTYLTLYITQIDPLVLLGIVGFLRFHQHKEHWLAGVALTLVVIKSHPVYLIWIALGAWVLKERQWQIMLGGLIGVAVATIIPLIFAPGIFSNYIQLYSTTEAPRPLDWANHTVSAALGLLFGLENVWVRYIPLLIGLCWFTFYWRKQRLDWNWTKQMPLLLLVSQATTVFAWVWDQILLLPALICGAVWAFRGGRRRMIRAGLVGFLMINLPPLLVVSKVLIPNGFWLFWMVPVFLLAYSIFKTKAAPAFTRHDA